MSSHPGSSPSTPRSHTIGSPQHADSSTGYEPNLRGMAPQQMVPGTQTWGQTTVTAGSLQNGTNTPPPLQTFHGPPLQTQQVQIPTLPLQMEQFGTTDQVGGTTDQVRGDQGTMVPVFRPNLQSLPVRDDGQAAHHSLTPTVGTPRDLTPRTPRDPWRDFYTDDDDTMGVHRPQKV